ncbi:MAG: carboxymuconolactone decarboxylase family protein [Thermoplasmata archaeon]
MAKLPKPFEEFKRDHPEVFAAYQRLGDATLEAGPLDGKTRELVKLGISLGAGMEGAAHSHARRAREHGATAEELRHAALLALTTLGFPSMMRGLLWVEDVLGRE